MKYYNDTEANTELRTCSKCHRIKLIKEFLRLEKKGPLLDGKYISTYSFVCQECTEPEIEKFTREYCEKFDPDYKVKQK